ncbi:MAG: hypothetical protein Q4D65_04140 [Peptostreptococcaceae bacterium]|nr:hypothetical protein [Peptostreptococcaceae bacterium]
MSNYEAVSLVFQAATILIMIAALAVSIIVLFKKDKKSKKNSA